MKDNQENQWFSHNRMAAAEPNMKKLLKKYGALGYGRWWLLVELLRGQSEYKLRFATDEDYKAIIQDLLINKTDTARAYIADCLHFGLLRTDGEYIWSEDLCKRMEKMDKNRTSYSLRGKKSAALMQERKQQRLNNDTTEEATELQQNSTQYNTQHNNTQQNNTGIEIAPPQNFDAENKTDTNEPVNASTDQLDSHIATLMKDELYFVHPHCMSRGITPPQLQQWMLAFNKHLHYTGDVHKNEKDYRIHFAHWFKYQDAGSDAAGYKPLPGAIPKHQPATPPQGKSYDEILQARQREVDGI